MYLSSNYFREETESPSMRTILDTEFFVLNTNFLSVDIKCPIDRIIE